MPGDDSSLITGMSSAAFNQVQKRKEDKRDRGEIRQKLLPAAELVTAEVDKIIEDLSKPDIEKVKEYSYDGKPNTLEIYMAARAEATEQMKSLKQRLNNVLRDNKDKA